MKKLIITCDCCNKEIEEADVYSIQHYVHVSPDWNRMTGHSKLVEGSMYSISGRQVTKEFCLPCYNLVFSKVFETIKEHKKQ